MSLRMPIVSVVMATYNCSAYIDETVRSILNQTFIDFELLITDDFSTDGTFEKVQYYASVDPRIKLFRNDINSGAAVSRNRSIENSSAKYIAFIDSDDVWFSTKLFDQLDFMVKNNYPFTFTSYELIDKDNLSTGEFVDVHVPDVVGYKDLLAKRVTCGCSTVMIDRDQVGDFRMPLIRTGQDYATWLLILKKIDRAVLFKKVLTKYRITPGSISRNKFKKAIRQWQIYREVERLDFYSSFYYFCSYAYRAVFRR